MIGLLVLARRRMVRGNAPRRDVPRSLFEDEAGVLEPEPPRRHRLQPARGRYEPAEREAVQAGDARPGCGCSEPPDQLLRSLPGQKARQRDRVGAEGADRAADATPPG